jgi:hypothetical protein
MVLITRMRHGLGCLVQHSYNWPVTVLVTCASGATTILNSGQTFYPGGFALLRGA